MSLDKDLPSRRIILSDLNSKHELTSIINIKGQLATLLVSLCVNFSGIPPEVGLMFTTGVAMSFSTILDIYNSTEQQRKFKLLIEHIQQEFKSLNRRVDVVEQDLESALRQITQGTLEADTDEKIEYFAKSLASCVETRKLRMAEKSSILKDLQDLSSDHICLLDFAVKRELEERDIQKEDSSYPMYGLSVSDVSKENDIKYYLTQKLTADLQAKNLVRDSGIGKYDYRPLAKMSATDYGVNFIKFIKRNQKAATE